MDKVRVMKKRESDILRRNVKHFQFICNSKLCYTCGVAGAHMCQAEYVTIQTESNE